MSMPLQIFFHFLSEVMIRFGLKKHEKTSTSTTDICCLFRCDVANAVRGDVRLEAERGQKHRGSHTRDSQISQFSLDKDGIKSKLLLGFRNVSRPGFRMHSVLMERLIWKL